MIMDVLFHILYWW